MVNETQTKKVWIMEIQVPIKLGQGFLWTAVKCSDGRIYTYDSEAETLKMLDICYAIEYNYPCKILENQRRVRQVNSDEVENE